MNNTCHYLELFEVELSIYVHPEMITHQYDSVHVGALNNKCRSELSWTSKGGGVEEL